MKILLLILASSLLLSCGDSPKDNASSTIRSSGRTFTITKIEELSNYSEDNNRRLYEDFGDLLADLTSENYIGKIAYKDLPVTWWAGTADFYLQQWKVSSDDGGVWVTVYQRKNASGRIINVYDSDNVEPSDFYGMATRR
jgi:hypothetical protein